MILGYGAMRQQPATQKTGTSCFQKGGSLNAKAVLPIEDLPILLHKHDPVLRYDLEIFRQLDKLWKLYFHYAIEVSVADRVQRGIIGIQRLAENFVKPAFPYHGSIACTDYISC